MSRRYAKNRKYRIGDVAEVKRLRKCGLTFREIGEQVGLGEKGAFDVYQAADAVEMAVELADLTGVDLPVETSAGTVWCWPAREPKGGGRVYGCDKCGFEAACQAAVRRGDFLACEAPLAWEVRWKRSPVDESAVELQDA